MQQIRDTSPNAMDTPGIILYNRVAVNKSTYWLFIKFSDYEPAGSEYRRILKQ